MSVTTRRTRRIRWALVSVPLLIWAVALKVSSLHPWDGRGSRPVAIAIYQEALVIAVAMVLVNTYESISGFVRERRRYVTNSRPGTD
jgi:hypothetical protein